MKVVLAPAAAIALVGVATLLARVLLRQTRIHPVPSIATGPFDLDDVVDDRFPKMLLLAPVPLALFSIVALVILQRAQTYGEAIIGLLLSSVAMSMVLPPLTAGLLLWSHGIERIPRAEEIEILAAVHRSGLHVREVWMSRVPIVTFWRPSLVTPSLVVGTKLLVWTRARRLDRRLLGGLAYSPSALFWPYAMWPLVAAAGFRITDATSVVPWWLFLAATTLIAAPLGASLLTWRRIWSAARTDAGTPNAIRGMLVLGLVQSKLIGARGPGTVPQVVAAAGWDRTLRRADRLARIALQSPRFVDEAVAEAMAREPAISSA